MPEGRILFSKRCGPNRILVSGETPHSPRWLSESCCGPSECFVFVRFVPCNIESPDPACTPPPEFGEVYICENALCSLDSPYRPGEPFGTPGLLLLVIWYEGQCWRSDGGVDRPNLPPGAIVIEAGEFRCMGRLCGDNPDCGTLNYAEAQPCDPAVPRPWPLYCPAGLPGVCSAINPASLGPLQQPHWNSCFIFRRDAQTGAYPPNTPIVTISPAQWVEGQSCCDCTLGCFRTGRLNSFFRPGLTYPGCCCGDVDNAILLIDGSSYGEQYAEGPNGPYRNGEEYYTWTGTSLTGLISVTYRQVIYNPDGSLVSDTTFPPFNVGMPATQCPVNLPPLFGVGADYSPQFDQNGQGYETRSCTRYTTGWSGSFNGNPSVIPYGGNHNWGVVARLIGMVSDPGCQNDSCDGAQPAMAPATENGGIRVRGGGSQMVDPAVAAWMQRSYGGCKSCGDSPNPL